MLKLLSIVVPCYNSQAYLKRCIGSLLPISNDVEILIVNDGSTDQTAEIAEAYQQGYPSIVRVIHQANGGHGSAVMAGLRNATGAYFKVVDSDDWLDRKAYKAVLSTLNELAMQKRTVDMLITNYVYDKQDSGHTHTVRYTNVFPTNRIIGWEDIGHFRIGQYILMHATIYRTQLLISCNLQLPSHTFYVDNLYVYSPMPMVDRLLYLNVDLYHYYIGRNDQSVNEEVMIRRIDQQIKVNKLMLDQVDLSKVFPRKKRRYMRNYLEIVTTVSSILLIKAGTWESLAKKKELWRYMKHHSPHVYLQLRHRMMGEMAHLPGKMGRKFARSIYEISRKWVGFN
jgi:glycosyltransferase involved in cell wall biosynthesis